jgi:hypothetical protein
MKTFNLNGFSIIGIDLEKFLSEMEDRETLEVVKSEGHTFLYRSKTNQMYILSDPFIKGREND